jgi:predicted acetyltransferase
MSEKIILTSPALAHRESYISLVEESRSANERLTPWLIGLPYDDFPKLLQTFKDFSKESDRPVGFGTHAELVPSSTYFLVNTATNEVLGVSNLRHRLNPELEFRGGHIGYGIRPSQRRKGLATLILAKSLDKAKNLGLDKVLLTCAKDNLGSVKTITNNGGILLNEEFIPAHNEIIQRYNINL